MVGTSACTQRCCAATSTGTGMIRDHGRLEAVAVEAIRHSVRTGRGFSNAQAAVERPPREKDDMTGFVVPCF